MLLRATFLRVMPVWLRVTCAGRYLVAVVLVLLNGATGVEAQVKVSRLGPGGGTIVDLAVAGDASPVVYAVARHGDHPTNWVFRVHIQPDGSVADRPDPSDIYLLGSRGSDVTVHPHNQDIVFSGHFRSSDGGDSWKAMNDVVRVLAFNPLHPNTAWARGTEGLLLSRDAGLTWSSLAEVDLLEMVVSVGDTSAVLGRTDTHLIRSADGGASWIELDLPEAPASAGISPWDAATLFAGTASGLHLSTDAGQTWTVVLETGPVIQIEVDPTDSTRLFAIADGEIHRSIDGGTTWVSSQQGLDASATIVRIDPFEPGRLLAGASDVGAFQSVDDGLTWSPVLISSVRFSAEPFTLNPGGTHQLVATLQDTPGALISDDGGITWSAYDFGTPVPPHVVFDFAYAQVDPSRVWATLIHNQPLSAVLLASVDAGESWTQVGWDNMPGSQFARIGIHPSDPDVIAVEKGFGDLRLSTDGGNSWTHHPYLLPGPVHDFAFVADDPEVLFVSTRVTSWGEQRLMVTRDGGTTWSAIDEDGQVTGRLHATAGSDPTIYVARAHLPGGLFRSGTGEIAWEEVTLLSGGGGPDFRVFDVTGSPIATDVLYASTSEGLFVSTNGGETWSHVTDVVLNRLVADPDHSGTIWGAHYQLGVHRLDELPVATETGPPQAMDLTMSAPYPNPSGGYVRLTLTAPPGSDVTVTVYDLLGRPVRSLAVPAVGGGGRLELQWDGRDEVGRVVPAGVYVVTLSTAGERVARTILRL